jgi:hypothetical protein
MADPSDIRREQIEDNLRQDMELLKEWEDKLRLAENPTERKRCEAEIDRLNRSIRKLTAELEQLKHGAVRQEQAVRPTAPLEGEDETETGSTVIKQVAGDDAKQIGQVFGDVTFGQD